MNTIWVEGLVTIYFLHSIRLLEELCASDSENCKKFVAAKRQEILSFLLKSLKKTKVTNRGARLRCLFRMVKLLPKDQIDAVKTIIPETIICCKDINQNTRAYAFKMLEEVFNICRVSTETSVTFFLTKKKFLFWSPC